MKNKPLIIGTSLLILFVVGFTYAIAQTNSDTFYACVNNSSGTIHMINEGEICNNNEQLYEWNNAGPPGPQGEKGDPGEPGAQGPPGVLGFYTLSKTISVPPGIFSGEVHKCDSGEDRATGGGYWTGLPFFNISHNHPVENSDGEPYAWHVSGSNNHNDTDNITIYVICADLTP